MTRFTITSSTATTTLAAVAVLAAAVPMARAQLTPGEQEQLDQTQAAIIQLAKDADQFWVMFGAVLVFMMQLGFTMLEVGCVRQKNTKNILIKNMYDASIGALLFWLCGWGMAFGEDSGGVVGSSQYATEGIMSSSNYGVWLFQWAFAATACTIVSGAVAERIKFEIYLGYAAVIVGIVYPIVVHWGWGEGWASAFRSSSKSHLLFGCGVVDFAGSGVVHMTGGVAALVGCYMVGPRRQRFNTDGSVNPIPGQSTAFQVMGTLLLWTGWFGFNGASTVAIFGASDVASRAMACTAIAAASGCIASSLTGYFMDRTYDTADINNGVLSGLVAITAGCAVVEPEAAFIIGVIAAFVYHAADTGLIHMGLDDVVGAIPVHAANGLWGVIATGLFATKAFYGEAYDANRAQQCAGVFYGGEGNLLAANICFALAIIVWVGLATWVAFLVMHYTMGLRVTGDVEDIGIDATKHAGMEQAQVRPQGVVPLEVLSP